MRDFTLGSYERLIELFLDKGIPVFGVANWIREGRSDGVLLRHDVDRKPHRALSMAKLEASNGIQSTYYFRVVGSSWNPMIIKEVASMGHEIGYHYEDLALVGGNREKALASFEMNLNRIREITSVATIAMHGSPLSRYNNLELWRNEEFQRFGVMGDAFLSVDYGNLTYLTDTGRRWDNSTVNLRDYPSTSSSSASACIRTTFDLINWINESNSVKLAISAHPERWTVSAVDYWSQLLTDLSANFAKRVVTNLRRFAV